jgi:hypothetical protein
MSQIAILKDTLRGHISVVDSVAFHPTALLLATGSGDNTAKLWRFSPDGSTVRCVATLEGHEDAVISVAFHPRANLLATGSFDTTAKLWLFSPDGSTVRCIATLEGHRDWVNSVAFDPTGTILATGSFDTTAKLWRFSPDGSTARCVATLEGHSEYVLSVAFHLTANLLATGSDDNTAKLWELNIQNIQNQIVPPILSSVGSSVVQLMQQRNIDRRPVSQQIPFAFAGSSDITIVPSLSGKTIRIPERLNPKINSNNKSCLSFKPLYDQIMHIDLNGYFRFEFEGQNAVDLTGLTRIVLDKLLPVYTHKFFEKPVDKDFIILKGDADIDELFHDTQQIIKLAKAAHSQILLRINPEFLRLLLSLNPTQSIAGNQNFNSLYANLKAKIAEVEEWGMNMSNYLLKNERDRKLPIQSFENININDLTEEIQAEIILRKKLFDFGLTSWIQYENFSLFIKTFWNRSNENKITVTRGGQQVKLDLFTFEIKFDIPSFTSRLLIKRNETILDFSNTSKLPYAEYPALRALIQYITDTSPNGDENRQIFTKYATGSEYSPDIIKIILTNTTMRPDLYNGSSLYGHSCDSRVDLFMAPSNYKGTINQNMINIAFRNTISGLRVSER